MEKAMTMKQPELDRPKRTATMHEIEYVHRELEQKMKTLLELTGGLSEVLLGHQEKRQLREDLDHDEFTPGLLSGMYKNLLKMDSDLGHIIDRVETIFHCIDPAKNTQ